MKAPERKQERKQECTPSSKTLINRAIRPLVACRALTVWLPACLALQGSVCWAGAPANDDCANAITLALGQTAFTTVGATSAGPGVCVTIGNDLLILKNSSRSGTSGSFPHPP